MDWLKKLVQAGQNALKGHEAFKNPENLDKDLINAVGAYIGLVSEDEPELGVALLRYIIDGTDEDVLLKLVASSKAKEKLGLVGTFQQAQAGCKARAQIWRGDRRASPEFWIRLATLIERCKINPLNVQSPLTAWFSILFNEILDSYSSISSADKEKTYRWSMIELCKIIAAGELPDDVLVIPLIDGQAHRTLRGATFYYYYGGTGIVDYLADLDKYFNQHKEAIRAFLKQANPDQKVYALNVLSQAEFDFAPMIDFLVELGTGSSKVVRDAALPLLISYGDKCLTSVQQVLSHGAAAERNEAVSLLWRVLGADSTEVLKKHLETEKSDRVKQTIEKFLAVPDAVAALSIDKIELAPVDIKLGQCLISEEAKSYLHSYFQKGYEGSLRQYEKQLQQWDSPDRPKWMSKPVEPEKMTQDLENQIIHFVEGKEKLLAVSPNKVSSLVQFAGAPMGDWLRPPGVELIHVVRLAYALRFLNMNQRGNELHLWWNNLGTLELYRSQCDKPFGLRELDAAVATLPGASPGAIAKNYLSSNSKWTTFCDWEPESVWPVFAEYPSLLREVLSPAAMKTASQDFWHSTKRNNVFRVLAMFPNVPGEYLHLLWDLALAEAKTERPAAQEALRRVPGKTAKIIVALCDGKAGVRAAAAEWLGKLGDKTAIEPIKKAFAKEKNEMVKGAFMLALDDLHADVDEFLNRDQLVEEAKVGLSKKRPKGMEWFPLESLPKMHWQDSGKELDPNIVQWWVVQSVQQKLPHCGPILRRYLKMCRSADVTALSRFVLRSWIARDTTTASAEDAAKLAQDETDKLWNQYGQHQYYIDAYGGKKENLYKQIYQRVSNDCLYSAVEQKGMLALVSVGGDGDCVKICEKFIRTWFGNRLAQCKSLIEVLSDIDHPLALQTLLAIANRFRTKAIKLLAEEQVKAIAEAQGWTLDELADRTIPDAGFERPLDEAGEPVGNEAVLQLDFGPRQFEVRLNDELEPVIKAQGEAKALKSLPAPGKNDDPEKAAAAKKAFTDGKKVAKEVVKRQTERFYEALCTQRSWLFSDWQRYLAQHPIVGRLCVRLSWVAYAPTVEIASDGSQKQFLACFRPLEDGSLTNENDEEVKLPENAIIVLAHTCNVTPEIAEAWIKHYKDYDVTPLFQQFGRATYNLPEEKKNATELSDFEGHLITTFKLRAKATKLGYLRGEAEDGGCFYLYRKSFTSLSIQAVLEFTGSYLPEQDIPAALVALHFVNLQGDREQSNWNASKMPLSKVPAVLLSECYNDIKQIAAEGSGFDPKWKEKSYF